MNTPDNIFLVGPMGAGKSTIGRRLARALGRHFLDSDKEIEQRTGASISWIFDKEGESGFRAREKLMIDELTRRPDIVLATGGGSILDPDNRHRLRERGLVIYLNVSIGEQLRRTRRDTNRPLLQTGDRRKRLEELFEIRDPLYREVAHFIIGTDRRQAHGVVQTILHHLERHRNRTIITTKNIE